MKTIEQLIELLKEKEQSDEVQFMVLSSTGQIVVMELTDELVDMQKFFNSFRKPKK